ncbi:acyltransferase family protein [Pseudomonas sp.]|jgi:peptidoglycan/LPS O-acetylase OafA/YrhL|uniref:acyltransferase family protein n=1 Tax=Pseudomonas sp. TaxID=306 RepID=UPI002E30DF75|nr:acyltransferase family protein [Pseudomonas sp.]HEX4550147.1 acyltransferase family protein [Pseudomonas sp.]
MHSKNTAYRPDIDGLRAVAVLLVLLFHFEFGVSGGFIGVDVFFVISGFLITEVIRNSLRNNRFSFFDFYIRRLLRLHPALLITVALCIGAGFILMDPASFNSLAISAKYSVFSASNFYFWLNQGYFDATAQTQPLLHTWSLAAEWQFYIIWPLIVWGALKISEKFLTGLLAAITLISVIASQAMLAVDSSAAYFMMPFRVFELSIGALLVFLVRHRASNATESWITIAGLGLILGSAFALDASSPFPGLRALAPTLGAAACIYGARSRAGALLRYGPMVKVGLISYSVYLAHWPIAVFYKYYVFRNITFFEKTALLVASIIVGAALYVTVERIFMKKWRNVKAIGLASVAMSVVMLTYGAFLITQTNGVSSRIAPRYLTTSFLKLTSDPVNFHINNYGGHGFELDTVLGDTKTNPLAIMAGDSFALQYASGMDKELKERSASISGVFRHGCILSGEYTRIINNVPRQDCKDAYQSALAKLKGNNLPFIYAQSWDDYHNMVADHAGINAEKKGTPYSSVIEDILTRARADIGDRPFFIIGSQPYLRANANTAFCLLRPKYVPQPCDNFLEYPIDASTTYAINQVLKTFAASHANTFYFDPSPTFCKSGVCETVIDGKMMYSDSSHLSIDGSLVAGKQILNDILSDLSL